MDEYNKLYEFIELAQKNRKYPTNTAHGRRAALKLFESVLHLDELGSLDLIEERIEEIYLSLISAYKNKFSIKSLSTYKGRFLKLIKDYKKYGKNPSLMDKWEVKQRKYNKKIDSKEKDIDQSNISSSINRHVYKVTISLDNNREIVIQLPNKLTKEDTSIITKIILSLSE